MSSCTCPECGYSNSDPLMMSMHVRDHHGGGPPASVGGRRSRRPSRRSDDPMERIEWQLDQIRVNTLVVGVVAGLALIGLVINVLGALGALGAS